MEIYEAVKYVNGNRVGRTFQLFNFAGQILDESISITELYITARNLATDEENGEFRIIARRGYKVMDLGEKDLEARIPELRESTLRVGLSPEQVERLRKYHIEFERETTKA